MGGKGMTPELFPAAHVDIDTVAAALSAVRLTRAGQAETALHDALAAALRAAGLLFLREHVIAPRCRVDLWVDGIVIEVKCGLPDGRAVQAQLARYAAVPAVRGVILVCERRRSLAPEIAGKPVRSLCLNALWSVSV